jgi:hypothetical protein
MSGVRVIGIAVLASWLVLACSGTHERPGPPVLQPALPPSAAAAGSPPPAYGAAEPSAGAWGTGSTPSAVRADATGVARTSPMQTLNQMLTAQALLVSLLLAPVSKDVGQAPLARLEQPAP